MAYSAFFWNRMAEGYAKKPVADESSYQKKLALTQALLKPDMNVLEFACGTGTTALKHAPFVRSYEGVDVSKKMIEIANAKLSDRTEKNICFTVSSFESCIRPSESYDAILGMSILHLVHDLPATLAKVHRLLKPGGYFFSSTVCMGNMSPIFRYILPIPGFLGLLPKLSFFSDDYLIEQLKLAGFKIEQEFVPKPSRESIFLVARKPI